MFNHFHLELDFFRRYLDHLKRLRLEIAFKLLLIVVNYDEFQSKF